MWGAPSAGSPFTEPGGGGVFSGSIRDTVSPIQEENVLLMEMAVRILIFENRKTSFWEKIRPFFLPNTRYLKGTIPVTKGVGAWGSSHV